MNFVLQIYGNYQKKIVIGSLCCMCDTSRMKKYLFVISDYEHLKAVFFFFKK